MLTSDHVISGASRPTIEIDVPEGDDAVRLVPRAAPREARPHARGRRQVVVVPGHDEQGQVHRLEALDVVGLVAAEAALRGPAEHVEHLGESGAIEGEPQVLLEDVRLARAGVPAAERKRVEGALGEAPEQAHRHPDRGQRQGRVGQGRERHGPEEEREGPERQRPAREVIRAADGGDPRDGPREVRRRRVRDQAPERVPDDPYAPPPGEGLHLFDRGGDVLAHIVLHPATAARAEMTRPAVTAKVEIEYVEPRAREVVREAPGGQVPRVAVLAKPVNQQHRRPRPLAVGDPLADHGQRDAASGDNDFFSKRGTLVSIDQLSDDAAVENHSGGPEEALPQSTGL